MGGGATGASNGASGASASGAGAGGASGANGNSGAGGNGQIHTIAPVCPQGYVLKGGSCLHASNGVLPDNELYEQGRALALAGYYAYALPILQAVSRTDDSMVYTMLGYVQRRLGRFEAGMALYEKALAIDPDNVNTHEYMGEGYVQIGKMDLARVELATVRRICGSTDCEQYEDLARAVDTGEVDGGW
jgi:tetratricopeptide (TPR) repeat protein